LPGPLRLRWVVIATAIITALWAGLIPFAIYNRRGSLPYNDSFSTDGADEWSSYGGAWQLKNATVFNRSDERGAKLVTGSDSWTNYELDADLQLIGHEGDVGVIVRASQEERGVDAYRGYYVGLRSADSALVAGRADHGWMEGQPVPMAGGVQTGEWYRIRVVVFGCRIGAEATNLATMQSSWAALEDEPCFSSGKIGLRSMATGGAWRNISVRSTTETAWQEIRSHASLLARPTFPAREADYSRMRERFFPDSSPIRAYRSFDTAGDSPGGSILALPRITDISSLSTGPPGTPAITIRGVITLTDPLYVQDATGSIAVHTTSPTDLNLGDEVEITGATVVNGFTPEFVPSRVRLLWDRTLVVPVSVTSTQAASGTFNASLVEVRGTLASVTTAADHVTTLKLYDAAQTFTAVVRNGLSARPYSTWLPGSTLSIRGICRLPAESTDAGAAFTVLLRGADDIQVLAGPPWWTGKQLIRLLCLLVSLLACGIYLYNALERWKLGVIMGERERLAHEMHDTLAQSFAGIGFHLQGLYNGLKNGNDRTADIVPKLHDACEMVAHSHREASASIAALQPDSTDGQDLLTALDRSTREMLHSRGETALLPLTFSRSGTARPFSTAVRDALFHIGREAIINIIRHAHATTMEVSLHYEPKLAVMRIRDDGVGFSLSHSPNGFGLRSIRRRCEKIGAIFNIETDVGAGTALTILAPYGRRPRLTDWVRSLRHRHSREGWR
jgi:signal transduction histidine kinase